MYALLSLLGYSEQGWKEVLVLSLSLGAGAPLWTVDPWIFVHGAPHMKAGGRWILSSIQNCSLHLFGEMLDEQSMHEWCAFQLHVCCSSLLRHVHTMSSEVGPNNPHLPVRRLKTRKKNTVRMDQLSKKKVQIWGGMMKKKKKKKPHTRKKHERKKEGTWRKIHCTNHIEIAHTLLPRLKDGW